MDPDISRLLDLCENRGKKLHDHQSQFLSFFKQCVDSGHGCILADEMGLGKTLQAVCACLYVSMVVPKAKCLICCPVSVLATWQDELKRFDPELIVELYRGDKASREKTHSRLLGPSKNGTDAPWNVLLSTYEVCLSDRGFLDQISWSCLVSDEAHRLKNSSTASFEAFSSFNVKIWLLLTGTPVQNNLKELYSFLCLVQPSVYDKGGERRFVSTYRDVGNSSRVGELRQLLKPLMLRRTKAEVGLDIPSCSEVTLYHSTSDLQKDIYKSILTRNRENFKSLTRVSFLSTLMQIRKCICHPYLFGGVEPEPFCEGEHLVDASGKLKALDVLLDYLRRKGHRVLIFSQFVRVLDVIQDYLTYRSYAYERLDGSIRAEERFAAIDRFSTQDTFCFLLSTRAGGLGLNLTAADTVIFYDSDWNPQNDLQAAARAHRIGQAKHVRIIRLVGRHTVEELILDKCGEKLKLADAVMSEPEGEKKKEATKWVEFLTYGLSDLMSGGRDTDKEEPTDLDDAKLERILGSTTRDGEWTMRQVDSEPDGAVEGLRPETENLYTFEGHDYTEEAKAADKAALDTLTIDMAKVDFGGGFMLPAPPGVAGGGSPANRGRRATERFDYGEIEDQSAEAMQKSAERAKAAQRRAEARRAQLWDEAGYTSTNLRDLQNLEPESSASKSSEPSTSTAVVDVQMLDDDAANVEDAENEAAAAQLAFVKGDVTQPYDQGERVSVIVQCADNSGDWPDAGVFAALRRRLPTLPEDYANAKSMRDLNVGDAHRFWIDTKTCVVLLIAQSRVKGSVSKVNQSHLRHALDRLAQLDRDTPGGISVHLPRLGYGTRDFDWYAIERIIRKCISNRGIPACIYYFRRGSASNGRGPSRKRPSAEPGDREEWSEAKQPRLERSCGTHTPSSGTSTPLLPMENEQMPEIPDHPVIAAGEEGKPVFETNSPKEVVSKENPVSGKSKSKDYLPSIFTGLTFAFVEFDDATYEQQLRRLAVAFDAQLAAHTDCTDVTHVIVGGSGKHQNIARLRCGEKKKLVDKEWLENCLRQRVLLMESGYII